jgi:MerR family transcriptional regulator, copper efflux regulator
MVRALEVEASVSFELSLVPKRARGPQPASPIPGCAIGQAARASGVSAEMIRYYESVGLLRPVSRSASNYRAYDRAAVQTLRFIARARALGFTMDEIAKLLALWQEPGRTSADVKAVALRHIADLDERIRVLQGMKAAVESLAEHCHGDDRPDCPIIDELSDGRVDSEPTISRRHRHG